MDIAQYIQHPELLDRETVYDLRSLLALYPYYQNDAVSPFVNTAEQLATTYKFDKKPLIIGEFPASGWKGDTYNSNMAAKTQISTEDCYRKAFDGGYAGALAWQYIGDKTEDKFGGYTYTIEPALEAMKTLASKEMASIKIKDVTIEESTGNGMMAVTYGGDNAQIEYQKTFDLSAAKALSFEVKNNGKAAAKLYLIFKLTGWKWTEVDGECEVAAGAKKTCLFDISSIEGRNEVLQTTPRVIPAQSCTTSSRQGISPCSTSTPTSTTPLDVQPTIPKK